MTSINAHANKPRAKEDEIVTLRTRSRYLLKTNSIPPTMLETIVSCLYDNCLCREIMYRTAVCARWNRKNRNDTE